MTNPPKLEPEFNLQKAIHVIFAVQITLLFAGTPFLLLYIADASDDPAWEHGEGGLFITLGVAVFVVYAILGGTISAIIYRFISGKG